MSSEVEQQLAEIATERQRLQEKLIAMGAWQTCLNCFHWLSPKCDKFNATPPLNIIVSGCRDHKPDIPF